MTIPVLVQPETAELAVPYLTPAQFKAYPTWLDLDNLLPGGAAAAQPDVLADVLLAASVWAVGVCENMPLHGHWVQGEQLRLRANNLGRVAWQPRHVPVRAITSLSWGFDPTALNALTLPDPSMWVEQGREVSFQPGGSIAQFRGPALQFGAPARAGSLVYLNWSYVAGYPNTTMSAVSQGASSVTVADPTGVLPGDVLRIYDQGGGTEAISEALTVASTYTPAGPTIPPAPTSIPLAADTQFAHAAGTGITGMPRRALQAVYAYAVALLMREDVSAEEPVSAFGPAARSTAGARSGQAAGLVNDAIGWLSSYRPTLRT